MWQTFGSETVLFTQVPYDDVTDFLRTYSFHERSSDGDRGRLLKYIDQRVRTKPNL